MGWGSSDLTPVVGPGHRWYELQEAIGPTGCQFDRWALDRWRPRRILSLLLIGAVIHSTAVGMASATGCTHEMEAELFGRGIRPSIRPPIACDSIRELAGQPTTADGSHC